MVIKRVNKAVKYAFTHRFSLATRKLDQDSLLMVRFSDASFANNDNLTSQLGNVCFLSHLHGKVVPISFKSYKSKRTTRSVMAGEFIAFSEVFDVAVTLADKIEPLIR